MQLSDFFDLVSTVTDLHVCVWSATKSFKKKLLHTLPMRQQRHISSFCRVVMQNNPSRNCNGHDNIEMLTRAGELRTPFVNVCPAGAAEVIVPVINAKGQYIAVIFIGQARLPGSVPKTASMTFRNSESRMKYLERFNALPEIEEKRLLAIGQLVEASVYKMIQERELAELEKETTYANHPAIRKAIKIILSDDGVSVCESEIADELNMSQSHFSRLFKQEVGYTFSEFVTELRLNKALNLLMTTDLPISTIAFESGYTKQGYFARIFKKVTGSTPSQARNLGRKSFQYK